MTDRLVAALIDVIVLLEFSDASSVDPDAAVNAMESIAHQLRLIPDEERSKVVDAIIRSSGRYESPEVKEFVSDLPGMLGIL